MGSRTRLEDALTEAGFKDYEVDALADDIEVLENVGDDFSNALWDLQSSVNITPGQKRQVAQDLTTVLSKAAQATGRLIDKLTTTS